MRTLLRHRVVVLLGLVLLTGLASFACGGGKEIDTEKLVPEGSSLIGSIQFEKILNDVDLESIYQALPVDGGDLQTIDQLLNEAMAQTGVDFRKISHATFFADVSRPGRLLGPCPACPKRRGPRCPRESCRRTGSRPNPPPSRDRP